MRPGEPPIIRAVSYTHLDVYKRQFFLCAAALFPESSLVFDQLGMNPTRATLLDVLTALGAKIHVLNLEEKEGELIGSVQLSAPAQGLGATCLLYTSRCV